MEDASVRMTVDSSQAITENQKYLRAATETFKILQEKSAAYSQDLQKRIKFMEREIELQKESNRLNREKTISGYREEYEEGKISGKQRNRLIREAKEEADTDERELRETQRLVQEHKKEQQEALRRQKSEGRSSGGFGRLITGVTGSDTAGGMISSASGTLLAGSIVGAIAAIGIAKEIKGAMAMEPAMEDYARLRGVSMYSTRGDVSATKEMNLESMGMLPSQYFQGYSQLLRAGGGVMNESALGIMAAEQATGLSRGQTSQLMGVERYGEGKITPLISTFERYLKETKQSIAVLPEILQTFTNEATLMMRTTGRVDSDTIAGTIAALGKGTGLTGEPLSIVTGALRGGLQQSSDPTIQALQFTAMERAMPGASLWEMEKAMENPFSNPKYMTYMLSQLKTISGGDNEMYERYLYNVFGASGLTKNLASDLALGNLKPEDIQKDIDASKKTGTGGFRGRADASKGELAKVTADWQGAFERTGFVNSEEFAKEFKELLNSLSEGIKTQVENSVKNQEDIQKIGLDAIKEMREATTIQKKLYNWFVAAGTLGPNAYGT